MLVYKERLVNVPVMSLQTGGEIARTDRPIIDPRQLTIVAFYCQGPKLDVNPAILHVDDIRETSGLGFIVDSVDAIMSPNDLVRLQQIIGFNFSLEGKQVVEENGHKVGKVSNYTIDLRSFYITQLEVQRSFMQSLTMASLLIGRTQIIEITDKKIIVRSATITKEASTNTKLVENPFRNSRPQPEVSHATHDDA
jgi:sporulation protein YlmC with PRC-barrel domain